MSGARDVVVVGGGPVGLATAIAARREGLAVIVVDARRPPLDKACGEGVMPAGVAALTALGVDVAALGRAFSGIRYRAGGHVAEADFPGGAAGRGVRRIALHAALAARAAAAGVELRWGVAVTGLTREGVATGAGEIAARTVVGADGLHSKVRRWANLAAPRRGPERFGIRRHLALEAGSNRVEVIFGRRAEAYVTPVGAGEVGFALLWEGAARGLDALLADRFPPEVTARFAGARALSRDRGAGPFRQRTRGSVSSDGRVALVGDAAGYLDAVTGEGLALGFREAAALGGAIARGDLATYARASRRLRRVPEAITRLALAAARRPALARRTVAALGRDPGLFSHLLGALGAAAPLAGVGAAPALRFVVRLVAAPAGT